MSRVSDKAFESPCGETLASPPQHRYRMMPKHSSRAPWGRRLTAMFAVSLLTLGACSDSDSGGVGPSKITAVQIVTLPNNQTTTNLTPGDRRRIFGVPVNEDGNFIDKAVIYASSNAAIFTISNDTIIAQVGGGTAYLLATAGGKTDSIAIGVRFRVATITLAPATVTLRREGTQQLTATAKDANPAVVGGATVTGRTIAWTTSDAAVATVSATGLVSATAAAADASTATITATAANTADGGVATLSTRLVTISGDAVVSTVTITGGTGSNAIGFRGNVGTVQLTATARSGLGNVIVTPITWTTNAAPIGTVNSTGLATFAGGSGSVTVTGTALGAGNAGANVGSGAAFEVAPTLVNGATQTSGMAGGAGVSYAFSADRVGAANFSVVSSGGTGDGDLYVIAPGVANWTTTDGGGSNFVCRSWNSGNGENCGPIVAVNGWYRVRTYAWTPAGAVAGMNITLTHP